MANAGVGGDFLDEVSRHLLPGRSAIVSEIEEEMPASLDILLESLGGTIFCCVRRDVMDTQIAIDLDALHCEIKTLENALLLVGRFEGNTANEVRYCQDQVPNDKRASRRLAASIKEEP